MFSYLIVYILIIFVVVLLLVVVAATGYSAFVILSAAARTAFAMCRRLPPARHPLMWLYAAFLGYLLFPVLLADFAAAAPATRHVHDITVLRWWNNAWLCAVLVAANLPLLPLLHGEIRSGSPCFGTAFCVWCVLWCVFAAAWGLAALAAYSPEFAANYAAVFDALWPWQRGVLAHLEADSARTAEAFARPMLRYGSAVFFDGVSLFIATLPFFLLYSATLPRNNTPLSYGAAGMRHRIDELRGRRRRRRR
ncbi:TPA: hypothetical protein ACFP4Y_000670 [Neisseria bacilliformis]